MPEAVHSYGLLIFTDFSGEGPSSGTGGGLGGTLQIFFRITFLLNSTICVGVKLLATEQAKSQNS
jgi:hypothetical protein